MIPDKYRKSFVDLFALKEAKIYGDFYVVDIPPIAEECLWPRMTILVNDLSNSNFVYDLHFLEYADQRGRNVSFLISVLRDIEIGKLIS